jgi:hypothetical protein
MGSSFANESDFVDDSHEAVFVGRFHLRGKTHRVTHRQRGEFRRFNDTWKNMTKIRRNLAGRI